MPSRAAARGRVNMCDTAAIGELGWLALSNDRDFTRASGAQPWRLDAATGVVTRESWWTRWK